MWTKNFYWTLLNAFVCFVILENISMTWKTFIEPIHDILLESMSEATILTDIFIAAGRQKEFDVSSAYNWLSGRRKCKAIAYFPNGIINYKEVFNYFKKRPKEKLQSLQGVFRKQKDESSPIDVHTNKVNLFCLSLVNQFLVLLGFQLIDEESDGVSDLLKNSDFFNDTKKEQLKPDKKIKILDEFQTGIYDYNINRFLESSPNNFPYSGIVEDALSFANHIDYINNTHECSDIDSDIYKKIITFNNILFEYLNFLKGNAADVVNFPLFFKLKSDNEIILEAIKLEATEKYLLQLKSMCQEIQAEIALIHQEIHDKQVAELREKDKKILENRLSNLNRKS